MNATAETLNGEFLTVTSLDPVQINEVDVILPDVSTSNGVIHAIDEVLLPTSATNSIVDLALADENVSTLVELLTSAGLVETLQGDGPFTVFAPSNDAFAKLPSETVAFLTDPANMDELVNILTYHVVPGILLSTDLADGATAEAVNGGVLTVSSLDPLTINSDSRVTAADILANNGVIHVIDTVLTPADMSSGMSMSPTESPTSGADASAGTSPTGSPTSGSDLSAGISPTGSPTSAADVSSGMSPTESPTSAAVAAFSALTAVGVVFSSLFLSCNY